MNKLELTSEAINETPAPELLKGKRLITKEEIKILENQRNQSTNGWKNFYVDEEAFDTDCIHESMFSGWIVLGKLSKATLKFHDLVLDTGIYHSDVKNCFIGDYNAVKNVAYLDNYRLGSRVMLFNIQEMSCTNHSKFGNGIIKENEPESNRVWISVANENDGRAVLPFEDMITADAYLWSHYRNDDDLLAKFIEITDNQFPHTLDTFGFVDDDSVIKNTTLLKDVKVGKSAYIKGAFKLKNITVLSSEEEPSQIGEGVEMVNGIMGYGCKAFYQAVAVRFVIGRNCQLKYGARVLNTILGDNSTVSCCELLNNLIFPFHEQHHNSSFLIATTVAGQSNIAAGATIGSNHNSRSPDGEIVAKRGFWPGLCSDFKHNSKFASFVLASKGSYQHELDIPYPFALIIAGEGGDKSVHIIPAWWWMYDMFAITRNKYKFTKRDKRPVKVQNIETDPLAPDTMQEVIQALERLIALTANILPHLDEEAYERAQTPAERLQAAKDFLHQNPEADFTLSDPQCQKKYGATIFKPVRAYKMYRRIVKYYASRTVFAFVKKQNTDRLTKDIIRKIRNIPLYTEWENVGGQIMPSALVQELFRKIKEGSIKTWAEIHDYYNECQANYEDYCTRYAIYLLEKLYDRPIERFTRDLCDNIKADVIVISSDMYTAAISSREKDYSDYYRQMVYSSYSEMEKVLGSIKDNDFLRNLRKTTADFNNDLSNLFADF
ncbi:MAG: DUF4954 family protein [Treponema sp.]|nr:DUF4954 family protein [Treponema sp.]